MGKKEELKEITEQMSNLKWGWIWNFLFILVGYVFLASFIIGDFYFYLGIGFIIYGLIDETIREIKLSKLKIYQARLK